MITIEKNEYIRLLTAELILLKKLMIDALAGEMLNQNININKEKLEQRMLEVENKLNKYTS